MQAKDIADQEIIDAILACRGKHGVPNWAVSWDVIKHLSKYPRKVVIAKLRSCLRRNLFDGHLCGSGTKTICRGDFELPLDKYPIPGYQNSLTD